MPAFDRTDAEAAGWTVVLETEGRLRAEKRTSKGKLINEEAETGELLLRRIHSWEQWQENVTPGAIEATTHDFEA